MKLHSYYRSSASYRVRIALNLKGVSYETVFHHLRRGDQHVPEYRALNPQGLVPSLNIGSTVLTQSLAICEYLDEIYPNPSLLPADPVARAHVRAFAQVIACEIHPIQNLKILRKLRGAGLNEPQVADWAKTIVAEGFNACEALIAREAGPYCFGGAVTLADIFLVPQLFNARRFGVELKWPRLQAAEAQCLSRDEFRRAAPEAQPDAKTAAESSGEN